MTRAAFFDLDKTVLRIDTGMSWMRFLHRKGEVTTRYLAQAVVNGQYVLRIRDDSAALHEDREDTRARRMRRTLIGLGAAAMWWDHRRRRPPTS